jgi:hypothetical protein
VTLLRAGVTAQPGESLVDGDRAALGEDSLRLLDGDPAVQRLLELVGDYVRLVEGPVLQERDGRDVGECLGEEEVGPSSIAGVARNR